MYIFLKIELFVLISLFCFTILILGIIILNSGSEDLSERKKMVDTVFHVMKKVLYSVCFAKVPSWPRS